MDELAIPEFMLRSVSRIRVGLDGISLEFRVVKDHVIELRWENGSITWYIDRVKSHTLLNAVVQALQQGVGPWIDRELERIRQLEAN
jgi:hypothetical protein